MDSPSPWDISGGLMSKSIRYVLVYDSWSQHPKGILVGAMNQLGMYEECLNVHSPVQGQYCLAAIELDKVGRNPFDPKGNDELQSFDNAWNEILEVRLFIIIFWVLYFRF